MKVKYETAQNQNLDDWRIATVEPIPLSYYGWSWDGPKVEVYRVVCEFHSADPAHIVLAGGAYLDENGWAGGLFPMETVCLVCTVDESGNRTFLKSLISSDCAVGGPLFFEELQNTLAQAER